MKFSVLLPTRNRLEYLKFAIETVRRQDYANWEIVVSDNCSEEDIESFIVSLGDPRVLYVRTSEAVPVTQNWNNALRHSSGDYIVMLGDDDGLMPAYFSTLVDTLKAYPEPDFVYLGAYFFAYRGAVTAEPRGFLRRDRSSLFDSNEPYWLGTEAASSIADGYLNFRMPVASNMQFSLISRNLLSQLSDAGVFFRSPFPDFYATPLLFLRAKRILIIPRPLVLIGITPKSYGAFHFSASASGGAEMLNNSGQLERARSLSSVMLPGSSYYDSWLLAMEDLAARCGPSMGLRPNYRRYRFLQIVHAVKGRYFDKRLSDLDLAPLREKLTWSERLVLFSPLMFAFLALRLFPDIVRGRVVTTLRHAIGQHTIGASEGECAQYQNLLEVYEAFTNSKNGARITV